MRNALSLLGRPAVWSSLPLLLACSTPPPLPTVDGAHRRAVNSPSALALQSCRSSLQRSEYRMTQLQAVLDTACAGCRLAAAGPRAAPPPGPALNRMPPGLPGRDEPLGLPEPGAAVAIPLPQPEDSSRACTACERAANTVFMVHFAWGSAAPQWPAGLLRTIAEAGGDAPLILLRGRTDGRHDSLADSRLARDRALAVRDDLVAAGLAASRLRVTYQPVGDSLADPGDAAGRALNRRVEIEIYATLPQVVGRRPAEDGAMQHPPSAVPLRATP